MSKSTRNTGRACPLRPFSSCSTWRHNTPRRVIGLKLGLTEQAVRSKAADEGVSLKPTNQPPHNRGSK